MTEISKLRADSQNQNHISNSLSMAQSEISKLQTELRHQQNRFEDLQKAYNTLEKSMNSGSVNANSNRTGVKWDNSTLNERDRQYEVNVEGDLETVTPSKVSSKTTAEISHMINERTIQSELYKVL